MSVNDLIPLEDMKRIATKCAEEAETFEDFYVAVIEEVYKLGFQRGKDQAERKE